jgi:hypothetical protein
MEYYVQPWEHQLRAIERAKGMRDFALFFEMGCVASSTRVKVNRGGASREYSIEELYRKFHSVGLAPRERGFDLTIPTYCRSWNGKFIQRNRIVNVLRQGEKKVFRIKLKRHEIKVTEDHELLTQRGWVAARFLMPGKDFLAIDTLFKHQRKRRKKKSPKPRYGTNQVGPFHPFGYRTRLRGKKIFQLEVHRIIFDAHQNGLSLEEFKKATFAKNNLQFTDPKKFHIHHRDGNYRNNRIENLERLPKEVHLQHHCRGYENFEHGKVGFRIVQSVEPIGMEMTYDLVCDNPHRNFVANGIVVHNCGKTGTAINILRHKFEQAGRQRMRTLVLCPPIVVNNWVKEFHIHAKFFSVPLVGPGKKRLELFKTLAGDNTIFVTNYESLLMKDLYEAIKAWGPECLVFDESHKCKDITAKRTKAAAALAEQSRHNFILTGTPTPNSPMDIFSQFFLLDRGASFGKSYFVFRARHCWDRNAGMPRNIHFPKWEIRPGALDALNQKIYAKAMRVTKAEALDLPPLVRVTREVEMLPEQQRVYEQMRDDYVAFLNSDACMADLAITHALRLQQIVSGYVKLDSGDEKSFTDTPRLKAVEELLEELTPNHKVIVWAVFHQNYKDLRTVCEKLKIKYVEVHGGISAKSKDLSVDLFNTDPSTRVLIGNQQAGGIGINLTAASYSIFYSRNFSLEQDLQAESRNHRGGSKEAGHSKITRIDLLTPGTIDEVVLEALQQKQNVSEELLRNLKAKL